MSGEINKCSFCGEHKPVLRFSLYVRNKHFDDNKQGRYSTFVYYCADCGIKTKTGERVVSILEDYVGKGKDFPEDFLFLITEAVNPDNELSK